METRANYALIGLFTLAVIAAAFGFVFWFSGKDASTKLATYRVVFNGSVSGLSRGALVMYNGLRVGEVTSLQLQAEDPSKVVARIDVDATTPMNVDTRARLEFQGLTGVASIQLSGGRPGSPPLQSPDGKLPPVIYADRSDFQDLLESAQRLAKRADDVLTKADALFADNAGSISRTVRNVETFSDALAANSQGVAQFLSSTGNAADKIATLSQDLQKLTENIDRIVRGVNPDDVKNVVANLQDITSAVAAEKAKISQIIADASTLTSRLSGTSEKLDKAIDGAASVLGAVDPAKLSRSIDSIDRFSVALSDSAPRVDELLRNASELSGKLNRSGDKVEGLLVDVQQAVRGLDGVFRGVDGVKVARTIDNIDKFTTALGDSSGRVDEIARNANDLVTKLNKSADKIDAVLQSAQDVLGSDTTKGALGEFTAMSQSIRKLAENLDKRTAELTGGINKAANSGLQSVEQLAQDSRRTLNEINRTLRSFEANPQQLIFGNKPSIPEYGGKR